MRVGLSFFDLTLCFPHPHTHISWHLTIQLTSVVLHADRGRVEPADGVKPNEPGNQRRKESVSIRHVCFLVTAEHLVKCNETNTQCGINTSAVWFVVASIKLWPPPSWIPCCRLYRRTTSVGRCCRRLCISAQSGARGTAWLPVFPPGWSQLAAGNPPLQGKVQS